MNGQNPNNQFNQNEQNNLGINSSVLGSINSNTNSINQNGVMPNNQMQNNANINLQSESLNNNINQTQVPNSMNLGSSSPNNLNQNLATNIPNNNAQMGSNLNTYESLNQNVTNNGPVAQPIPGTEGTYQADSLTGNTVGVGSTQVGQDSVNTNSFVEPNHIQNIGGMPPENSQPVKTKKGMNKTLFIVLIIVLIAAVAFGVYYFLNISNKVKVTVKEVNIGVGETLSDDINDYATITGNDASSCTLNNRNVNSTAIGEYEFEINCGKDVYTGKVIVSDKTAPIAITNVVYKNINDPVEADEFISSCDDPSGCTYTFADEESIQGYLQTAGGPYTIGMNVTDNAGNTATVDAYLYVSAYNIMAYTSCSLENQTVTGYQATKTITDLFPIGRDGNNELAYLGIGRRIYTYVFNSADEYSKVAGEKTNTLTFDNITGLASYDDENKTIKLSIDLSNTTLNSEAGGTFGTSYAIFRQYYTNKGYTCSNSQNP